MRWDVVHPGFRWDYLLCEDGLDKNKKEINCTDCPCKKEDCRHENLKYCEGCNGVRCMDCGVMWGRSSDWSTYWYNTDDMDGPTHTWETDSGGNYVARESRRNDHCMKPGERDWNPT